jgi:hypothetical protein
MTRFVIGMAVLLAIVPMAARADSQMIEVARSGGGGGVTVRKLLAAPAFQDERTREATFVQVRAGLAAASFESDELRDDSAAALRALEAAARGGKIDELPFRRIADLSIGIGFPEMLNACLEAHPVGGLAIEACASAALWVTLVGANIKYRWDLVLHQTSRGGVHQLSLGPSLGVMLPASCGAWGCDEDRIFPSAFASLEYVYWFTRHFGLTIQLDLGVAGIIDGTEQGYVFDNVLPMGKLTVGFAF